MDRSEITKVELEAAEGLATLSQLILLQPTQINNNQTKTSFNQQDHAKLPETKIDRYADELKPNPSRFYTIGSGSSKSKQNLTEAEKELKKLTRVLSNREAARETIRRKQAIYDELKKKAAYLELENENLKREMEFAIKVYYSTKIKNELLKAQLMKTIPEEELKNINVTTSSAPCPILIYSQPSHSPFLWHSFVQTSNNVHTQTPTEPTANPESYFTYPFLPLFQFPNNQEENSVSHLGKKVQTESPNPVDPVDIHQGGHSYRQGEMKKSSTVAALSVKYLSIFGIKKVDPVTAAMNRSRRKEMIRLKNLRFRRST